MKTKEPKVVKAWGLLRWGELCGVASVSPLTPSDSFERLTRVVIVPEAEWRKIQKQLRRKR